MPEIIKDICQQDDEWFKLRIGSIGGSSISQAVAGGKGKSKATLMYRLIGEMLSGEKYDGYSNPYMQMGNELEPECRELYEFVTENQVEQIGMFKYDDHRHYSPDGLIETKDGLGLIEIKCVIPSTWAEVKISNKIDTSYRKQMQYGLGISGREFCDYVVYCSKIKDASPLIIIRVERDEKEIKDLMEGSEVFIKEMLELYKKISA